MKRLFLPHREPAVLLMVRQRKLWQQHDPSSSQVPARSARRPNLFSMVVLSGVIRTVCTPLLGIVLLLAMSLLATEAVRADGYNL